MPDNKYSIDINQGDTFFLNLTVKEANGALKNLTGYSARMQMRTSYAAITATETLSTTNGEISINTSSSIISLTLPASRTANIAVDLDAGSPPKSKYVYDLELTDSSNNVSKLIYGDVTVYGEVTRG